MNIQIIVLASFEGLASEISVEGVGWIAVGATKKG